MNTKNANFYQMTTTMCLSSQNQKKLSKFLSVFIIMITNFMIMVFYISLFLYKKSLNGKHSALFKWYVHGV